MTYLEKQSPARMQGFAEIAPTGFTDPANFSKGGNEKMAGKLYQKTVILATTLASASMIDRECKPNF
jgi:hypothetical protein